MKQLKRILSLLLAAVMLLLSLGVAEEGVPGESEPVGIEASEPAPEPEPEPAEELAAEPTAEPEAEPTAEPEAEPTVEPEAEPTAEPEAEPTAEPAGDEPAQAPTEAPEVEPTAEPEAEPTAEPTQVPVIDETPVEPTQEPEAAPAMTVRVEQTAPATLHAIVEGAQGEVAYRWQALDMAAYQEQLLAGELPDVEAMWTDIPDADADVLDAFAALGEACANYGYRCVATAGEQSAASELCKVELPEELPEAGEPMEDGDPLLDEQGHPVVAAWSECDEYGHSWGYDPYTYEPTGYCDVCGAKCPHTSGTVVYVEHEDNGSKKAEDYDRDYHIIYSTEYRVTYCAECWVELGREKIYDNASALEYHDFVDPDTYEELAHCRVCGHYNNAYDSNSCPHDNVCVEILNANNSSVKCTYVDEETHKYTGLLKLEAYCSDCYKTLKTWIAKEYVQEHWGSNGTDDLGLYQTDVICPDCKHRFVCEHKNKKPDGDENTIFYENTAGDENYHTVHTAGKYWICTDCGFSWLEKPGDLNAGNTVEDARKEPHEYGTDGKCVKCGAECKHTGGTETYYIPQDSSRVEEVDDRYHIVYANQDKVTSCAQCGKELGRETNAYTGTSYLEEHDYWDPATGREQVACVRCGFKGSINCKHPKKRQVIEATPADRATFTYLYIDDSFHSTSGDMKVATYCVDCGKLLGTENSSSCWEKHVFATDGSVGGKDDKLFCIYCKRTINCAHEDKSMLLEGDAVNEFYENVGDPKKHVLHRWSDYWKCNDCGYIWRDENGGTEELVEEAHLFRNAQHNWDTCIKCGAENPYAGADVDLMIVDDVVTEYNGREKNVVIPNGVKAIADNAFENCFQLRSVQIPSSVKSIGAYAFYGCYSLRRVNLPEGIAEIKPYTFKGCKSLNQITLPSSLKAIGEYAFADSLLTSIRIPGGVTTISDHAFESCVFMQSVQIDEGVRNIGKYAFAYSGEDTFDYVDYVENCLNITLPSSIQSIGAGAFVSCENLLIYVKKGSYAETFCKNNYIKYRTLNARKTLTIYGLRDGDSIPLDGYKLRWSKVSGADTYWIRLGYTAPYDFAPEYWFYYDSHNYLQISFYDMKWYDADEEVSIWIGAYDKVGSQYVLLAENSLSVMLKENMVVPTSISLGAKTASVAEGQSLQLQATLAPANAQSGIQYTTSNAKVATVSADGLVTAKAKGTATITAETLNGKKATCKVSVVAAAKTITVSPAEATLAAGGETAQLTVKLPKNTAATLSYESSNPGVATVDANGLITGVSVGTAKITVKTHTGVTDTCDVKVVDPPTVVTLDAESATLGNGEKLTLHAAVPESKTTFKVLNDHPELVTVAESKSVSGEFTVTAAKKGSGVATIRIQAHNYAPDKPELEKVCTVTVMSAPSKVTLNAKSKTLGQSATFELKATLPDGSASALTASTNSSKLATVAPKAGEPGTFLVTAGTKSTGTATITVKTFNGKKATCKVTVKKAPATITVSPEAVKLAAEGETYQLTVKLPKNTAASYTYESSDEGVATVDESGVVASGNVGTATITVRAHNGVEDTCEVEVVAPPTEVTLDAESATLGNGEALKLRADVPNSKTQYAVVLEPADSKLVTVKESKSVSGEFTVTAAKKGSGEVKVHIRVHNYEEGKPELEKVCAVTVTKAPTKVTLDAKSKTLGQGDAFVLKATLPDGSASKLTAKPNSSKLIEKVEQTGPDTFLVTAGKKSTGTATITVSTFNGKKATCKVTVKKAPTSVKLSQSEAELGVDETLTLKVTYAPSKSYGLVTWTSTDEGVVAVADGKLTAKGVGSATVMASVYNASDPEAPLTASCEVTVKAAPTEENATLTADSLEVKVKKTLQLRVEYTDAAGAVKSYKSSNTKVATVSKTGVVKGVKKGTAVITATLYNGTKITATITVTK